MGTRLRIQLAPRTTDTPQQSRREGRSRHVQDIPLNLKTVWKRQSSPQVHDSDVGHILWSAAQRTTEPPIERSHASTQQLIKTAIAKLLGSLSHRRRLYTHATHSKSTRRARCS